MSQQRTLKSTFLNKLASTQMYRDKVHALKLHDLHTYYWRMIFWSKTKIEVAWRGKGQNTEEQAAVFSHPYQDCVINYPLLSHTVRRERCLD